MPAGSQRSKRFIVQGAALEAGVLAPALYVVATPIGNLGDITLRALNLLAGADLILAEDTRVTRKLLTHYGISTPTERFDAHASAALIAAVSRRIDAGQAIALVSDAGTPLISDPGGGLVSQVRASGHKVIAAPGASALLAALVSTGIPADRFFFEGFLPQKSGPRRRRLRELDAIPGTLVFYEAPHRILETLEDLQAVLPRRKTAVARELTKTFETVYTGDAAAIAAELARMGTIKGEIVLLAAPPDDAATVEFDLDASLADAMASLSVKDAASVVAAAAGLPRREVYARALVLNASRKQFQG